MGLPAHSTFLDDPLLVKYAEWYIADFAPDDVICLSEYFFLKRWKAALLFFSVDSTFAAGFTPSSLRAGAATELFS